MARKKLLTEGEIRQFMKLANLRPVGGKRLSEMGMPYPGARDEDEELESELGATEDELGAEDAVADEEGDELAGMEDEMAMDDAGGGDMVSMDDFMAALEQAIEEVTGEEADVSEEPGEEVEDVDVDMEMEMGPEGGEEMEMSAEEEMVAEVVRRVMERQKYGGNKGDIPDADRKKKGHYGRGGKTRETAKEEGEEDFKEGRELEELATGRGYDTSAPERRGTRGSGDTDAAVCADRGGKWDGKKCTKDGKVLFPKDLGGGIDEQAIVQEVARRVTQRLQRQSAHEQMVDHLAERIMKRLVK
tara:strand:- start:7353 stop:8258 length:906 start_codon:yes stop_codon:yes gene_type:complete